MGFGEAGGAAFGGSLTTDGGASLEPDKNGHAVAASTIVVDASTPPTINHSLRGEAVLAVAAVEALLDFSIGRVAIPV
jgi:hypothetical protein